MKPPFTFDTENMLCENMESQAPATVGWSQPPSTVLLSSPQASFLSSVIGASAATGMGYDVSWSGTPHAVRAIAPKVLLPQLQCVRKRLSHVKAMEDR